MSQNKKGTIMTHWGWYWKVKLSWYKPKGLCSWYVSMDSFEMFRNKEGVAWCMNKVAYEVPGYNLKATLLIDRYHVEYNGGSYSIPYEKQACNYGGFRYFFRCPKCDKRMRILYCKEGKFLCRKCLNLGYFLQRLRPSERLLMMKVKAEDKIKNMAGSLERKPPWIKNKTFKKLKIQYVKYDEKYFHARGKEFRQEFGQNPPDYWYCPPSGMFDVYDDLLKNRRRKKK